MFARIKHMAIVSSNVNLEGDFYRDVFGMKRSGVARAGGAVVVRDGYVGLNLNPRAPGRQAGFDHFGFEVEDVELVFQRLKEKYPSVRVLKRPSNRPFAGISSHDPAGNVFDLSQKGMENRTDLYVDQDEVRPRRIGHFALRAVEPEKIAEFYRTVFDLNELEKPAGDANHYLTDGTVTLAIFPWQITDFAGSGIERPALDHIGFKVESMAAFKADLEKYQNDYAPPADPRPEKNPEREVRRQLFARCCFGQFQMSDPDGVLIDVAEAS
ncbi:MAG TPA: VOC family protein [candidate division Zixibacteria bacterium]|nr:VOC family protein [candidate division Zixibacteria bacterium]